LAHTKNLDKLVDLNNSLVSCWMTIRQLWPTHSHRNLRRAALYIEFGRDDALLAKHSCNLVHLSPLHCLHQPVIILIPVGVLKDRERERDQHIHNISIYTKTAESC